MKVIDLGNYGTLISESRVGQQIYDDIKIELTQSEQGEVVKIDFSKVISMATFCARQVFGKLYIELGPTEFKRRLSLENANDSVKSVITEAIRYSVAHNL